MLFGGRLSKDVPCASRLMPLMGGEDPSRSSYHLLLLLRTKKVVAFFAGSKLTKHHPDKHKDKSIESVPYIVGVRVN